MGLVIFSIACMFVIAACTFGAFVRWYNNQEPKYAYGFIITVVCLIAAFVWNILVVSPLVYA